MVAIIIITAVIIEAEVAMAMVVTFTGHVVTEEAIIIHTINITHMMMGLSLSNMVHHAYFVEASIILLNIALRKNTILTILWRK